jgi:lysozyme family protein
MPDGSRFFPEAVRRLLENEGGYCNRPADRGGETFLGISRRFFPKWEGWPIVDSLRSRGVMPSRENAELVKLAQRFYELTFYDPIGGDRLGDQRLATEMLDQAVNLGVGRAKRFLQESINLLNRGAKDVVVVDGQVGPATITELRKLNPAHVYRVLNALQAEHYLKLCRGDSSQEEFIRGWLERTV